ncbi:protein HEG homolog 1-like [Poeciliopsis prolifica]|uniref:protein HEG homolog 1-like n=1 Tax=Poeciliopsis prolifica TaxID=188132 RepID=UPI0024144F25|nr:protein HEG homolog 1-like [Poeciliopsis prolifica]
MADKTSQIFKETAKDVTDEIDKQFSGENNGYISSLVLELRENKANTRSLTNNVEASVEIFYKVTSDITEETVQETMGKVACDTCPLAQSSENKDACNPTVCDTTSSTCNHTNGLLTCKCNYGYINTGYTDKLCLACPAGEKAEGDACKPCDFGRMGFNCEDETLLIVVIVGSVLGFLMIVGLIAQPFVLKKLKNKGSKSKEEDLWKSKQTPSFVKPPPPYSSSNEFYTWIKEPANSLANSGFPRIPRANTSSNWAGKTNLEMTPTNSRQNLVSSGRNSRFNDYQDDMFSFSQSRPKINPYEKLQSGNSTFPQYRTTNPYAQIRGQPNFY